MNHSRFNSSLGLMIPGKPMAPVQVNAFLPLLSQESQCLCPKPASKNVQGHIPGWGNSTQEIKLQNYLSSSELGFCLDEESVRRKKESRAVNPKWKLAEVFLQLSTFLFSHHENPPDSHSVKICEISICGTKIYEILNCITTTVSIYIRITITGLFLVVCHFQKSWDNVGVVKYVNLQRDVTVKNNRERER